MDVLRTPDACFDAVGGFDHPVRYATIPDQGGATLRMAFVDAGPPRGDVVLLLHGEPSWSYLYRTMIPVLVDAGLRVIAPDLVGFGRSDKPAKVADHSYARHVEWLRSLVVDVLDLNAITLVAQDWGGLLGLRLAAENMNRFRRIVAANTGMPTGDHNMPPEWHRFHHYIQTTDDPAIGDIVSSLCLTPLASEVRAAYDAPFPQAAFKAGPRALPSLVPLHPDDPASAANRAAWVTLESSDIPVLVAFSDADPITGGMAPIMKRLLPGARGREHPVIRGAGHFLQEDAGPQLAQHVAHFILTT